MDIFTRAVSRDQPPVVELTPGVLVRHIEAGPFEDLDKSDLPGQLCQFTFEVLREEAAHAPGRYDLVHGHYWLSGQVGAVAKERWGVPLVQSMHTLGKVKNAALAAGDAAEPDLRIRGETEVIATADRIVANTDAEARELIKLYDAAPGRVAAVTPRRGPGHVPARVAAPGPAPPRHRAQRDRAHVRRAGSAAQGARHPAAGRRRARPRPSPAGRPARRGLRRRPERHRPQRP